MPLSGAHFALKERIMVQTDGFEFNIDFHRSYQYGGRKHKPLTIVLVKETKIITICCNYYSPDFQGTKKGVGPCPTPFKL